ncbi:sulfatase-like hydrolase/transferase [Myxococcota bacterium]|nr:sulfatase-like hydrolase/transferase [Myxococcota bacterium]MBU1898546.1 sulfatase-like hydrolase/transferase [Myxococcota bacterium]
MSRVTAPLSLALSAALLAALGEALICELSRYTPALFALALGLYLPLIPLLGGALVLGRVALTGRVVAALRATPGAALAALTYALWGLAALAGLTLWSVTLIQDRVRGDLAAVAIAVAVALSGAAILFGGLLLDKPLLRALARRRAAARWGLAALLNLPLLIGAGWGILETLGKHIPPATLAPIGGALMGLAWGGWLMRRGVAARTALVLAPLALIAAAVGLWRYTHSPTLRLAFAPAPLGGLMVAQLNRLFDADKDGFPPWLGDCDDADPLRHPLSPDLPQDGVDQDCSGADALPYTPPARGLIPRGVEGASLRRRWNILFITVDALRADHLSQYGYARPTSPHLDALLKGGLFFRRAYPTANSTLLSLPTLLTGRLGADMPFDRNADLLTLSPENRSIAVRLSEAGWHTEAQLSGQIRNGMCVGLERGFDVFEGHAEATLKNNPAPLLIRKVGKSILREARRGRPFFIWTHLLEPHEPYNRHAAHDFGGSKVDRYDGEIAAVDEAVGRLFEALDVAGVRQDTIIVFTADHGEAFGEHGDYYHGLKLYEESVRVPLFIHIPGAPSVTVEAPTSLIDVVATLADLVDLPPAEDNKARSHLGALFNAPPPARPVIIENMHSIHAPYARRLAMIDWPYKVSRNLKQGHLRIFNLRDDPGERRRLDPDDPEARRVVEALDAEARRQSAVMLDSLLRARIHAALPTDRDLKPQGDEIIKGLRLIATKISVPPATDGLVREVSAFFEVEAPIKADLMTRVEVIEGSGRALRRVEDRPLRGAYPTPSWRPGQIIEERAVMRFGRNFKRARVMLSVLRGGEVIFGPARLGDIKMSASAR